MTINCKCGGKTKVRIGGDRRLDSDRAFGTSSRWRVCVVCGNLEKSVEMWAGDLTELRRKAYLHELAEAQKTGAKPLPGRRSMAARQGVAQ